MEKEQIAEIGKQNVDSKGFFIDVLETFVSSFAVLLVIYLSIAFPEVVLGASMEPSLHTGERILVERVTKHVIDFERGDIVVLHPPGDDNIDYVKRVIAVPGDIVKVYNCEVFITKGGEKFKLDEGYLDAGTCTAGGPALRDGRSLKIEDNEYFVLGDNRQKSADSRTFGPVKKERIVGRVIFRFWPTDSFGFI